MLVPQEEIDKVAYNLNQWLMEDCIDHLIILSIDFKSNF